MKRCERCFDTLYLDEVNMLGGQCLCTICYMIMLSRKTMKEDKDAE